MYFLSWPQNRVRPFVYFTLHNINTILTRLSLRLRLGRYGTYAGMPTTTDSSSTKRRDYLADKNLAIDESPIKSSLFVTSMALQAVMTRA